MGPVPDAEIHGLCTPLATFSSQRERPLLQAYHQSLFLVVSQYVETILQALEMTGQE